MIDLAHRQHASHFKVGGLKRFSDLDGKSYHSYNGKRRWFPLPAEVMNMGTLYGSTSLL